MDNAYKDLFEKYIKNTNGKEIVAKNLAKILHQHNCASLLDVGGGRGEIAKILSNTISNITLIEKNELQTKALISEAPQKIKIVNCSIEDFKSSEKFDAILFSYLLDSYNSDFIIKILNQIQYLLSPNGVILGVTYLDGCSWDAFDFVLSKNLNTIRTGGLARIQDKLSQTNYYTKIIDVVDTQIFGDDLFQLYENLKFFSIDNLTDYKKNKDTIIEFLKDFVILNDSSKPELGVLEIIYEIFSIENYKF